MSFSAACFYKDNHLQHPQQYAPTRRSVPRSIAVGSLGHLFANYPIESKVGDPSCPNQLSQKDPIEKPHESAHGHDQQAEIPQTAEGAQRVYHRDSHPPKALLMLFAIPLAIRRIFFSLSASTMTRASASVPE